MERNYYFIGQPDINPPTPRRKHAIATRAVRPADLPRAPTGRAGHQRWIARLATLPARLWAKLRLGQERRRAARELAALSDRMLEDIGVSRCDIEYLQQGGQTKHVSCRRD